MECSVQAAQVCRPRNDQSPNHLHGRLHRQVRYTVYCRQAAASPTLTRYSALCWHLARCGDAGGRRPKTAKGRAILKQAKMLLRMLSEAGEGACLQHLPYVGEKDINVRSADGATALHYAACAGYADVCLELLESPMFTQANDQDASGCTALHYAACRGHHEVCHALLQHWRFSAQDAQDWNGWTALHAAAAHGQCTACTAFLDSPRFKVLTARDKNGMTAQPSSFGTLTFARRKMS